MHTLVLHEAGDDGRSEPVFIVECRCGWTAAPAHALKAYTKREALALHDKHRRKP